MPAEGERPGAPDAAVVCCVERGSLEVKAACMIVSLRQHWGSWRDVPIYAYSPRPGHGVSAWVRELYARYGVTAVEEPINRDYPDYPLANKPLAMAHAERTLEEAYLVFLDSDIFCWSTPHLLRLARDKCLGLVVDGTPTVASRGPHDERYEPMWQGLYRLAGARFEPYVTTLLTGDRVRGWWSSGVVAARRSSGLMARWLSVFEEAVRRDLFVADAHYLREQLSLCAVAAAAYDGFSELPVSYNYPVQNHKHYTRQGTSPGDAVLWHYQPFLNRAFRQLQTTIDGCPDAEGKIRLTIEFIERVRHRYASMIGLDETLLRKWRRQLMLGPRLRRLIGQPKPTDPGL